MTTRPSTASSLHGVGLGLRRSMLAELAERTRPLDVDFLEVAPENWIGVGGAYGRRFPDLVAQYHSIARFSHDCGVSSTSTAWPAIRST